MAKFNYREIHKSVTNSKVGEKRVRTVWENKLAENKQFLLREFDSHPVTVEINNGPDPSVKNISDTLGGEGNLFSFLGFDKGNNPTAEVRNILENEVVLATGVRREAKSDRSRFRFSLRIPIQRINEVAKLPWEAGKSWTSGIERGVSGFGHYLWKKFSEYSRSGFGLQAKNQIRQGAFKPRRYLSEIFDNFIARLKK